MARFTCSAEEVLINISSVGNKTIFVILTVLLLSQKLLAFDGFDNDEFRVFDGNNLIEVLEDASNIPARYQKLVDAVGFMSVLCTATHIGGGYVLTAGHCMWGGPKAEKNLPCGDVTIRWGYRENQESYLESTCEKIIIKQVTDGADFALIKVSPIPYAKIPVDLSKKPALGSNVTMFSHPNSEPLQWSRLCRTLKVIPSSFDYKFLFHKCDTMPGSSGAALINPINLKVVGIHNGGQGDEANYATYVMGNNLTTVLKRLFE